MTAIDRDSRRRFSARERAALLVYAAGHCTHCGVALHSDFHADHRAPWAHGGVTDVTNGQALCSSCNLRKSDHLAPSTTPKPGHHSAESVVAACAAATPSRHRPARSPEVTVVAAGHASECHKEIS